jgi:phage terminase large subunit
MPSQTDAARQIRKWRDHPAQMVRDLFGVTPDAWQEDVLEAFPHNPRIAMKASKGPGKTCVLAWLSWNFLLTRPQPKIAATSISADNLADNLWTEMAYWRGKSPLLQDQFEWTKTRISARSCPETWWMSARTWAKSADRNQQSQTLAGLHADYIMFVLDESGSMPDAIMASAEAALSSCKEGHIVQAGNPTHLEGPLYRACTAERSLWHVVEISGDPDDPKRAPRVSIDWAREQILKYGRDNPYVLINVFGRFPPSSLNTLIGPDEVTDAMRRHYREWDIEASPRVLGVDVARFGDDSSVIFPRQGLASFNPLRYRNLRAHEGAGAVARKIADWKADATFVDDTGGYGAGWIDALLQLGHEPIGIAFSSSPSDSRYYNKRTEMFFDAVEWIKRGGQLPPIDADGSSELLAALTQTTYSFKGDRMLLEPKEMLKARLGFSPDHADALGLTFAQPVIRKGARVRGGSITSDYDPFHAVNRAPVSQGVTANYDPFGAN